MQLLLILLSVATLFSIVGCMYMFRKHKTKTYHQTDKSIISENLFKGVFQNSYDTILLLRGSTIIECNDRALKMFGAHRPDIIGKNPFDISPEFQPDGSLSKQKATELINRTYKEGSLHFEWTHKKASGELFFTEVSVSAYQYNDIFYLTANIRDITAFRKDQDELEKYRLHLEQLVNEQTAQLSEANAELKTANEELDSTNEELSATNEELFSTNEELEHSNASLLKEIDEHKKPRLKKLSLKKS